MAASRGNKIIYSNKFKNRRIHKEGPIHMQRGGIISSNPYVHNEENQENMFIPNIRQKGHEQRALRPNRSTNPSISPDLGTYKEEKSGVYTTPRVKYIGEDEVCFDLSPLHNSTPSDMNSREEGREKEKYEMYNGHRGRREGRKILGELPIRRESKILEERESRGMNMNMGVESPNKECINSPNMIYSPSGNIEENWEDIPIAQLKNLQGGIEGKEGVTEGDILGIEGSLTLEKRVLHPLWQVRKNAYLYISALIQGDIDNTGDNISNTEDNTSDNNILIYSKYIHNMIEESNITAQYEGLKTVLNYLTHTRDIPNNLLASLLPPLLDKTPNTRPNFQTLIYLIFNAYIEHDQTPILIQQLLQRIPQKNTRLSLFCIGYLQSVLSNPAFSQEVSLRQIFERSLASLAHKNSLVKDNLLKLIQSIYVIVLDELSALATHFMRLKPVLKNELIKMLDHTQKLGDREMDRIYLYPLANNTNKKGNNKQVAHNGKNDIQKPIINKKQKVLESQDEEENILEFYLAENIREDFYKLIYVRDLETKRRLLEEFNTVLEEYIGKGGAKYNPKDPKLYLNIINVILTMLEDTNVLVIFETIKSTKYLSIIMQKRIPKIKQLLSKLLDKFKETKTNIQNILMECIGEIIKNNCISGELFLSTIFTTIFNSKNGRIRNGCLQYINDRLQQIIKAVPNPQDKSMTFEESLDYLFTSKLDTVKSKEKFKLLFSIENLNKLICGNEYKLVNITTKDLNAGVRDKCIKMLAYIGIMVGECKALEDIINKLPKFRANEIYTRVREMNMCRRPEGDNEDQRENRTMRTMTPISPLLCDKQDILLFNDEKQRSKSAITAQNTGRTYRSDKSTTLTPDRIMTRSINKTISKTLYFLNLSTISPNMRKYIREFESYLQQLCDVVKERDQAISGIYQIFKDIGDDGVNQCRELLIQAIFNKVTKNCQSSSISVEVIQKLNVIIQNILIISVNGEPLKHKSELPNLLKLIFMLCPKGAGRLDLQIYKTLSLIYKNCNQSGGFWRVLCSEVSNLEFTLYSEEQFMKGVEIVIEWTGRNPKIGITQKDLKGLNNLLEALFWEGEEELLLYTKFGGRIGELRGILEKRIKKLGVYIYNKRIRSSGKKRELNMNISDNELQSAIVNATTVAMNINIPTLDIKRGMKTQIRGKERSRSGSREINTNIQIILEVIGEGNSLQLSKGIYMLQRLLDKMLSKEEGRSTIGNSPRGLFVLPFPLLSSLIYKLMEGLRYKNTNPLQIFKVITTLYLAISREETFRVFMYILPLITRDIFPQIGDDIVIKYYQVLNIWSKELTKHQISHSIYTLFHSDHNTLAFGAVFKWFRTQILGNYFTLNDIKEIIGLIILPLGETETEISHADYFGVFLNECCGLFGHAEVNKFIEINFGRSNSLYKQYISWYNREFPSNTTSPIIPSSNLDMNIDTVKVPPLSLLNKHKILTRMVENSQEEVLEEDKDNNNNNKSFHSLSPSINLNYKAESSADTPPIPRDEELACANLSTIIAKMTNVSTCNSKQSFSFDHSPNSALQSQNTKSMEGLKTEEGGSCLKTLSRNLSLDDQGKKEEINMNINVNNCTLKSSLMDDDDAFMHSLNHDIRQPSEESSNKKTMSESYIRTMEDLKQVNKCYLVQVTENQKLKDELKKVEDKNKKLLACQTKISKCSPRFGKKKADKPLTLNELSSDMEDLNENNGSPLHRQRSNEEFENQQFVPIIGGKKRDRNHRGGENLIKLKENRDTEKYELDLLQSQSNQKIFKFQEMLISSENPSEEVIIPLLEFFSNIGNQKGKIDLISGIHKSLENQDVILCLPEKNYLAIVDVCLRCCSLEKYQIAKEYRSKIPLDANPIKQKIDETLLQNEVTILLQQSLTLLVNSRTFTNVIIVLLRLLKHALPLDFTQLIPEDLNMYLRLLIKCLQQIMRALKHEDSESVRIFDLLLELYKIFKTHPPESLAANLTSIKELDVIYRCLKNLSDILIEIDPEKALSLVNFVYKEAESHQSTYLKYIVNTLDQRGKKDP